jgi:hypothetical protein
MDVSPVLVADLQAPEAVDPGKAAAEGPAAGRVDKDGAGGVGGAAALVFPALT